MPVFFREPIEAWKEGGRGDARRKRKSRWGLASRKQDFRIQGHATHAFTYFWTSPLPRAARKYRRGSRTRAPLFFFSFDQPTVSSNSPPHIEWKYVQALPYSFFFPFLSFPFRFASLFVSNTSCIINISDSRINFIIGNYNLSVSRKKTLPQK